MGWDCFVFFNLLGWSQLSGISATSGHGISWDASVDVSSLIFFGFKWNSFRMFQGSFISSHATPFFLLLGGVNLLVFFHMFNRNIQIASMKPSIWPHCWWPVPFLLIHVPFSNHIHSCPSFSTGFHVEPNFFSWAKKCVILPFLAQDVEMVVETMAQTGKEPTFCMGNAPRPPQILWVGVAELEMGWTCFSMPVSQHINGYTNRLYKWWFYNTHTHIYIYI